MIQGEKRGNHVLGLVWFMERELRSGSLDLSGPLFQWWHQETFAWKTMIVMITVGASRLFNKFTVFNTHEFIKSLKKSALKLYNLNKG